MTSSRTASVVIALAIIVAVIAFAMPAQAQMKRCPAWTGGREHFTEKSIRAAAAGDPRVESLIKFFIVLSQQEGNWDANNAVDSANNCVSYGHLGFFQANPGWWTRCGYGSNPTGYLANHKAQLVCYIDHWAKDAWRHGAKYWDVIKKIPKEKRKACIELTKRKGKNKETIKICATITPSSILAGLQPGPASSGAFSHYMNNNFECKDGCTKGQAPCGRDGAKTCVGKYVVLCACKNVSAITGMPPTKDDDNCEETFEGVPIDGSVVDKNGNVDKVAEKYPDCVDLKLMKTMVDAQLQYQTEAITMAQDFYNKQLMPDLYSCIKRLTDYFDVIETFLNGTIGNPFLAIMLNLVSGFLTDVCNMVVGTIINFIDTAVCLPIPQLNLSLDMPSLEQSSCPGGSSSLTQILSAVFDPGPSPNMVRGTPIKNMSFAPMFSDKK